MKKYLGSSFISVCVLSILVMLFPEILKAQRPELIIPATHSANSVIISPDDKWLVSAGSEGIKIWENKTGSLIKNQACIQVNHRY